MENFSSFNEGLLGIDLSEIKAAAYKFHTKKECILLMSEINTSLANDIVKEYKSLKEKWGSLDNLFKKIIQKEESKNEGIGTIILSTFGIHAFIKLLSVVRGKKSIATFFPRLFYSPTKDRYGHDELEAAIKTTRDIIISISFCVYTISFIIGSTSKFDDIYKSENGTYFNLPFSWNGINNYYVYDQAHKKYEFNRRDPDKFDIVYKDKKIGEFNDGVIYNLDGYAVITDVSIDKSVSYVTIDLERILIKKMKVNHAVGAKIGDLEKEKNDLWQKIHALDQTEDSLRTKTFENVNQARKIFRDAGIDYNQFTTMSEEVPEAEIRGKLEDTKPNYDSITINRVRAFLITRKVLTDENALGYLGLFTTMIFNNTSPRSFWTAMDIKHIFNKIKKLRDVISNLRNSEGNLKDILEFKSFEALNDSLNRLEEWKIVNQFMRSVPARQKSLIWKDGWWVPSLSSSSQYLTTSIAFIDKNPETLSLFLRKVSAIKTTTQFIDAITNLTNRLPWEYEYWIGKLENTRNVYVSWSSKEKGQIICIVFTHPAIKEIARGTNWCIVRSASYFRDYSSKGMQCVFYDFTKSEMDNESIIGFTISDSFAITDCNNKRDSSTRLPSEFTEPVTTRLNARHSVGRKLVPKFVNINLSKAIKKLDIGVFKLFRNSMSSFLSGNKYISKFLDFYD